MRYNPDTERGLRLEDVASQGMAAIRKLPKPQPAAQVWDCQNGRGWIDNPEASAPIAPTPEELESEATLALWSARYKLQQIEPGVVPAATIASLRRDICDIARELQRLS